MKNKQITVLFIALINLFSFQLLAQKKFELTDMDKLYTLTDPQISPDGKSVLGQDMSHECNLWFETRT